MIDEQHHIELNGQKYRLFESGGGGAHYIHQSEPLRPPNSVVVQGTNRQDLFQVRPDILLWSLTDWSGGEGQAKYDPSATNRHQQLFNVRAFERPGRLSPGPQFTALKDSGEVNDLSEEVLVRGSNGDIWAWRLSVAAQAYRLDVLGQHWEAATTVTGTNVPGNVPANDGIDYDGSKIYYLDTAGNVFKMNHDLTSSVRMNGAGNTIANPSALIALGDYIYALDYLNGFYEMAKSSGGAAAWTQLYAFNRLGGSGGSVYDQQDWLTVNDNRIFFLDRGTSGTAVHIVTPTSAAGAGSGTRLAFIPGLAATSLFYTGGLLYLLGSESNTASGIDPILFYVDPDDGTYGVVDWLHPTFIIGDSQGSARVAWGKSEGVGLTSAHIALSQQEYGIYELDLVSGGLARLVGLGAGAGPAMSPIRWFSNAKEMLLASNPTVAGKSYVASFDTYTTGDSYFTSPEHDFGLSDDKILSSIHVQCEPLPADWEIEVYYSIDDAAFVLAGTLSTDDATGASYSITTDTSTVTFRRLRVKVLFDYVGASAAPTTGPELTGVEVRAQVAKPQNVWRLKLDLMDDLGGSSQSLSGNQKISNVTTAGDSGTAIAFKDGYPYPLKMGTAQFDEYDVIVDSYNVVLEKPGEGYIDVVLREVA